MLVHILDNQCTQLVINLGPMPEPFLKTRNGLMQQHAETIDNGKSLPFGLDKEGSLQGDVDDIRYDGLRE